MNISLALSSLNERFSMKSKKTIKALALEHLSKGCSTAQIAEFLKVSQRTIQRWVQRGCSFLENIPRLKSRKLSDEQEDSVLEFIEVNSGIFQDEVVDFVLETHGVSISTSTVSRLLIKHGFTRKRGTRLKLKFKEEKGRRFLEAIRPIYERNPVVFASVDEMSVMLNVAPTYGYARRGKRAIVKQPGKRTVSYMLTLCISPVGVLYWNLRSGSVNAQTFSDFLKKLPNGLTLMLDNARIHHAKDCLYDLGLKSIAEVAEEKAIALTFIPAYAPHLNPVEFTFNLVRNLLRRRKAWTETKLIEALTELFQTDSFSQEAMTKLFRSVIRGGPNPGERFKE